jgi:hypothetical protein
VWGGGGGGRGRGEEGGWRGLLLFSGGCHVGRQKPWGASLYAWLAMTLASSHVLSEGFAVPLPFPLLPSRSCL